MRFVLDVHLGKLARHLRMLGFDALWEEAYSDEEIARIGKDERRLILTRDRRLLEERKIRRGYLVNAVEPKAQMKEVIRRFKLLKKIKPFTVCLECNGRIAQIAKEKVLDRLDAETKKYYDEFFTCRKCGKIYWRGSHYNRMEKLIEGLPKK